MYGLVLLILAFPVQYPENTKTMSDTQFYNWAVQRNIDELNNRPEPEYDFVISEETKGNIFGSNTHKTRVYKYQRSWPGPLTIVNPYVHPRNLKNGRSKTSKNVGF